jgi:hypothetical protein
MAFSSFPHYSRIVSASLNTAFIALLVFLLISKTRGRTKNVSEWQPLKRYYVFIFCAGNILLLSHASMILGCENDADYQTAYCITTYLGVISSISCALFFFVLSTLFAYKRLLGVYAGTSEHVFWERYKIAVIAITMAVIAVNATIAAIGLAGSVIDFISPSPSRQVTALRIAFLTTASPLVLLVMGGSTYCYFKMLWIILSSSSKLAVMKRTEDKNKVLAVQRRLYSLIVLAAGLSLVMALDLILNRLHFSYFNARYNVWWIDPGFVCNCSPASA